MAIKLIRKSQIEGRAKSLIKTQAQAKIKALLFDDAPTAIPAEYFNYSNIFLAKNVVKLPKYTGMNDYAIKLEEYR